MMNASHTPLTNPCSICGSTEFDTAYGGRKAADGSLPRCTKCGSLERHRVIAKIYQALSSFTATRKALQFAPDGSVKPTQFKSYTKSIFGSENSLDIMNTKLPDASFDIVISNHVLEHVPDDIAALREGLRLVGERGVVHLCVPSPTVVPVTRDWGFPDKTKAYHYRIYGADVGRRFLSAVEGAHAMVVVGRDDVTTAYEAVYFFSYSAATLDAMTGMLLKNQLPCVLMSGHDRKGQ